MGESSPDGSGAAAFAELVALRELLAVEATEQFELPEPSLVLDVASRHGSPDRVLKHIHQSCILHQLNLTAASRIKQIALVDAFIALAEAENPLGLYSIARATLELNGFLHQVCRRLQGAASQATTTNWQPAGENFFALLIRARFATTDAKLKAIIVSTGVSESRLKPFNITECLDSLGQADGHSDTKDRYAHLCDFVHHNLSSLTTANSGSGVADAARHESGGMFVPPQGTQMTISRYEYPISSKFALALDDIAPDFVYDTKACTTWLKAIPESPFGRALVEQVTGDRLDE